MDGIRDSNRPAAARQALDAAYPAVREVHPYPYTSRGKLPDGGGMRLMRERHPDCWARAYLQLNPSNCTATLALDVDAVQALQRLDAQYGVTMPYPNVQIVRSATRRRHVLYALATPVHRNANSNPATMQWLGRIVSYLTFMAGADASYTNLMQRNPFKPERFGCYVLPGRPRPYDLSELAEWIPKGWKLPVAEPRAALGRNCATFAAGMKWAGARRNLAMPVLSALEAWDAANNCPPLPPSELYWMAQQIEGHRHEWATRPQGWHRPGFVDWGRQDTNLQAMRAYLSGAARWRKSANQRTAAEALRGEGWAYRAIAKQLGVGVATVHRWLADRNGSERSICQRRVDAPATPRKALFPVDI